MRRTLISIFVISFFLVTFLFLKSESPEAQIINSNSAAQTQTIPEVIILAKSSKLGTVTFNHVKHNSGEYSVDGPIACIECHHTAQPALELAKHPPLKTDWPTGRTTTLTAELFKKDPKAAGVAACRDCHARLNEKPKLLDAIPVLKDPGGTILTKLTNQLAFHNACDACHFQISVNRVGSKVPDPTLCTSCHKRTT